MRHLKAVGAIIYTVLVSVCFIGVCIALYLYEIPASQKDLALILFGALVVCFKDAGGYWTGSTASSQSKDDTIAGIARKDP